MIIIDSMPTEGQFVAVWKHDDELYSETLKWISRTRLLRFRGYDDKWEPEAFPGYYELAEAKFVIEFSPDTSGTQKQENQERKK